MDKIIMKATNQCSHANAETEIYLMCLTLVEKIDADLVAGTRHYRDQSGHLITNLDEVIREVMTGWQMI